MYSRCHKGLAAIALCALALGACNRERRDLRPQIAQAVLHRDAARESDIQPGGPEPSVANPSAGKAYDISEGQRLYAWFNCVGCHSHGGGGMGPPLIKENWIYGGEPANIFDTIVKGRPNGMPAWGGKIPEYQIWQLVAYVRSMNHLEPRAASSTRSDEMEQNSTAIRGSGK
jgi:cytochrome c oxidase cbb3-type subunit 3